MLIKDISTVIAGELNVQPKQISAAIELLDAGNTVPFIARYRKEATGALEDEQLRLLADRLDYLRNLVKKQEEIINKIAEQGKLTADLQQAIEKASKLQELEDLYLPYKQKKRTRAQMARERGLTKLADMILDQEPAKGSPEKLAAAFINPAKDIPDTAAAITGAMDIVAETIMEDAALRQSMRLRLWNNGHIVTELDPKGEDAAIFSMYDNYQELIHTLPSHRILAINRGEKKGCLKVHLTIDHATNCQRIYQKVFKQNSIWNDTLQKAIEDGYKRLLFPALEREIRNQLTEIAEKQAIKIFGINLKQLLLQAPLAELVKIDPQAIGVGQYQHDVNQKELAHTLDATIETAVNHVGVDLNTASSALLNHIAGINAAIAKNIVAYRDEHGSFNSRKQLLNVPRLGKAAFTQCAGFLRIPAGTFPLDNTPVHPESYALAEKILTMLGFALSDLNDKNSLARLAAKIKSADPAKLATKLTAGEPTVADILAALLKPGRDPREDLPAPLTRQAIVKLSDIKPGTIMRGTVRNITDFGAFVDIGLKTAGLIHISEMSNHHIKHPLDVVAVGDILTVRVINVDEDRNRIGLSLKQVSRKEQSL